MAQLLLALTPEAPPTFDNFVYGRNNEICHQLQQIVDSYGFRAIYLWGPAGSGKSHLLSACAALPRRQRSVHFPPHGGLPSPEDALTSSLIIVDNVDALNESDQTQLFRLFNVARHQHLAIVLSAAVPPLELALREDLRTRIGQSLILQLQPLSDDEKRTALRHHSQQRGMRIDDSILNYLMHHGRRDLGSLLRVLDQLDQASLEQKRHPTLPLLRDLLQSSLNLTSP